MTNTGKLQVEIFPMLQRSAQRRKQFKTIQLCSFYPDITNAKPIHNKESSIL